MNRKGFSSSVLLTTVLLIGALVVGCGSGPVESFGVEVYARAAPSGELFESAGSLQLKEIPDLDPELEGLLLPGEEGFSSSEYELVYPEEGEAAGAWESRSLHIVYTSEQPLVLELLSGDDKKKEELTPQHRRLPATAGQEVRIVLPLGGEPLRFLQFHSEGAGDPSFNLRSLALQKENPPEAAVFYLPIPGAHEGAGSRFQQYGYTLEYSYHREMIPAAISESEEATPVVGFSLHGADREDPYRLSAREGRHSVHFYSKDLEFLPEHISLASMPPGFRVERLMVRPVSLYVRRIPEPIPADPGVILRYSEGTWRRSDWEIFSWNLFSNILIFDFRDYAVQSAFLKRLSFFVEKKGSVGRLLPNEVIDPLHGWNAHDYRAKDLARFFQLAAEENFPLNPEEYLLRDILLDRGIIYEKNGAYETGEGGLLSISRESSDRLRYLFITHEGYHGLYFASPEYRREVEGYWKGLSDDEQLFWKIFLDWKWYNTDDTGLVINEFQAYLMQQHISYVDTYFKEYTIPRFLRRFPEFEEKAAFFLETYPEHFTRAAAFVEESARSIAGISSGDLVCLRENKEE